MSKEMTVIVLGIWVAVVPYLGVPSLWRTVLLVVSGIGIAVIGFLLRGEALSRGAPVSRHATFVESSPSAQSPARNSSADIHEQKEGITSLN